MRSEGKWRVLTIPVVGVCFGVRPQVVYKPAPEEGTAPSCMRRREGERQGRTNDETERQTDNRQKYAILASIDCRLTSSHTALVPFARSIWLCAVTLGPVRSAARPFRPVHTPKSPITMAALVRMDTSTHTPSSGRRPGLDESSRATVSGTAALTSDLSSADRTPTGRPAQGWGHRRKGASQVWPSSLVAIEFASSIHPPCGEKISCRAASGRTSAGCRRDRDERHLG